MLILLLLPVTILYLVFTVWPLFEVARLSLLRTNFITTIFVGLENYAEILTDYDFLTSILNSLGYLFFLIPLHIGLALIVALTVCDMGKKWQDVTRIVIYIPTLSAGIIIAQCWKWLFHIDGPINYFITLMGFDAVNWFGSGIPAIPIISLIVGLSGFGGTVIYFLASILSIDPNLYDAAKIDGASSTQIKVKIILPLILPTIILMTLISAIGSFSIFETIFALAPQNYAASMAFYIYQTSFKFSQHGLGSAQGIILLIIVFVLSFIKKRFEHNE